MRRESYINIDILPREARELLEQFRDAEKVFSEIEDNLDLENRSRNGLGMGKPQELSQTTKERLEEFKKDKADFVKALQEYHDNVLLEDQQEEFRNAVFEFGVEIKPPERVEPTKTDLEAVKAEYAAKNAELTKVQEKLQKKSDAISKYNKYQTELEDEIKKSSDLNRIDVRKRYLLEAAIALFEASGGNNGDLLGLIGDENLDGNLEMVKHKLIEMPLTFDAENKITVLENLRDLETQKNSLKSEVEELKRIVDAGTRGGGVGLGSQKLTIFDLELPEGPESKKTMSQGMKKELVDVAQKKQKKLDEALKDKTPDEIVKEKEEEAKEFLDDKTHQDLKDQLLKYEILVGQNPKGKRSPNVQFEIETRAKNIVAATEQIRIQREKAQKLEMDVRYTLGYVREREGITPDDRESIIGKLSELESKLKKVVQDLGNGESRCKELAGKLKKVDADASESIVPPLKKVVIDESSDAVIMKLAESYFGEVGKFLDGDISSGLIGIMEIKDQIKSSSAEEVKEIDELIEKIEEAKAACEEFLEFSRKVSNLVDESGAEAEIEDARKEAIALKEEAQERLMQARIAYCKINELARSEKRKKGAEDADARRVAADANVKDKQYELEQSRIRQEQEKIEKMVPGKEKLAAAKNLLEDKFNKRFAEDQGRKAVYGNIGELLKDADQRLKDKEDELAKPGVIRTPKDDREIDLLKKQQDDYANYERISKTPEYKQQLEDFNRFVGLTPSKAGQINIDERVKEFKEYLEKHDVSNLELMREIAVFLKDMTGERIAFDENGKIIRGEDKKPIYLKTTINTKGNNLEVKTSTGLSFASLETINSHVPNPADSLAKQLKQIDQLRLKVESASDGLMTVSVVYDRKKVMSAEGVEMEVSDEDKPIGCRVVPVYPDDEIVVDGANVLLRAAVNLDVDWSQDQKTIQKQLGDIQRLKVQVERLTDQRITLMSTNHWHKSGSGWIEDPNKPSIFSLATTESRIVSERQILLSSNAPLTVVDDANKTPLLTDSEIVAENGRVSGKSGSRVINIPTGDVGELKQGGLTLQTRILAENCKLRLKAVNEELKLDQVNVDYNKARNKALFEFKKYEKEPEAKATINSNDPDRVNLLFETALASSNRLLAEAKESEALAIESIYDLILEETLFRVFGKELFERDGDVKGVTNVNLVSFLKTLLDGQQKFKAEAVEKFIRKDPRFSKDFVENILKFINPSVDIASIPVEPEDKDKVDKLNKLRDEWKNILIAFHPLDGSLVDEVTLRSLANGLMMDLQKHYGVSPDNVGRIIDAAINKQDIAHIVDEEVVLVLVARGCKIELDRIEEQQTTDKINKLNDIKNNWGDLLEIFDAADIDENRLRDKLKQYGVRPATVNVLIKAAKNGEEDVEGIIDIELELVKESTREARNNKLKTLPSNPQDLLKLLKDNFVQKSKFRFNDDSVYIISRELGVSADVAKQINEAITNNNDNQLQQILANEDRRIDRSGFPKHVVFQLKEQLRSLGKNVAYLTVNLLEIKGQLTTAKQQFENTGVLTNVQIHNLLASSYGISVPGINRVLEILGRHEKGTINEDAAKKELDVVYESEEKLIYDEESTLTRQMVDLGQAWRSGSKSSSEAVIMMVGNMSPELRAIGETDEAKATRELPKDLALARLRERVGLNISAAERDARIADIENNPSLNPDEKKKRKDALLHSIVNSPKERDAALKQQMTVEYGNLQRALEKLQKSYEEIALLEANINRALEGNTLSIEQREKLKQAKLKVAADKEEIKKRRDKIVKLLRSKQEDEQEDKKSKEEWWEKRREENPAQDINIDNKAPLKTPSSHPAHAQASPISDIDIIKKVVKGWMDGTLKHKDMRLWEKDIIYILKEALNHKGSPYAGVGVNVESGVRKNNLRIAEVYEMDKGRFFVNGALLDNPDFLTDKAIVALKSNNEFVRVGSGKGMLSPSDVVRTFRDNSRDRNDITFQVMDGNGAVTEVTCEKNNNDIYVDQTCGHKKLREDLKKDGIQGRALTVDDIDKYGLGVFNCRANDNKFVEKCTAVIEQVRGLGQLGGTKSATTIEP